MECDCKIGGPGGNNVVIPCDVHRKFAMAMIMMEREYCATLVDGHEEIGEARLVIAEQIRQRNPASAPSSPLELSSVVLENTIK